jgi:hypothetical protein
MFTRAWVVVSVVVAVVSISLPASAAPPPEASIAGVTMVESSFPWAECGAELTATFDNVRNGGYRVEFSIHDAIYLSTLTHWDRLSVGQTSASFQLGSGSPGGDTFDSGTVTVYSHGGRVLVDSKTTYATVTCP